MGAGIATVLAESGWLVLATSRTEFQSSDSSIQPIVLDPSDPEAALKLVSASPEGTIAALINNAASHPPSSAERDQEAWRTAFMTNVMAPLFLALDLQPRGLEVVINITSTPAEHGRGSSAQAVASKSALAGLTRWLAWRLAPVRVNAVAPGLVEPREGPREPLFLSDLTRRAVAESPIRRLALSAEIGGVCAFLMSKSAAYITGEVIHVDGGLYGGGGPL